MGWSPPASVRCSAPSGSAAFTGRSPVAAARWPHASARSTGSRRSCVSMARDCSRSPRSWLNRVASSRCTACSIRKSSGRLSQACALARPCSERPPSGPPLEPANEYRCPPRCLHPTRR
ncbi:hypothetical protein SN15_06775 [Stenotrophomonas maltophilia]|nr:hypothetical protein SN15_06775 [Stenotrophomonas maltophilia]